MRKLSWLWPCLCIYFLLAAPSAGHAQTTTPVSGVLRDAKGVPIIGATVRVKNGKTHALTDSTGFFRINLPPGASRTLIITNISYNEKEIDSRDSTGTMRITMISRESKLEDVVIIGYQSVTRKKTTAAISSISGKEIANLPSSSFDQLMQGRLSGVSVQNYSGEPGASPTVSVRGNSRISTAYDQFNVVSSPLYVVDGVPQPTETYVSQDVGTGTNYLGGVNPNDIESIDVLKDASAAAIYGSRAANGVILITTKKGRSGAPKTVVSGYAGATQRPQLRPVVTGTLERAQKLAILAASSNLTDVQKRNLPYLLTDSLNPAFNGHTDWQDLYYQTGMIKDVDLSLSGGGEGGTNYRFSSGYYDEQGIITATGFKRYTMRLNLLSKALGGKLTINPVVNFARIDRSRGSGSTGNPISVSAGSMPSSLFNLDPNKKAALLGKYNANFDKNTNTQFSFNLNLGYDFSRSFKFTSQNSYLYNTSRRDYNRPSLLNSGQGNSANAYSDNEVNVLSSNYLSYNKSFGQHNISVLVGQDVQYDLYQNTQSSGSHGSSDVIQTVQGFDQKYQLASSDYQAYGLLSYYSRVSYDYMGRYLLSASIREDGSSRFGVNNKWGTFPSISLGWLLSEESFMKNGKSPFSLLKVRASVGKSGSLPTSNYLQYNLYKTGAGTFEGNSTSTAYNGVNAITPDFTSGAAQPNLSWQKSTQWNLGFDAEVLNGKFSAALDIYNKENTDQLFNVNLPVNSGYDYAQTNSMGVRNYGVDLTIAGNPLSDKSPIKWFTRLNITYNKNRIMTLPNQGRDLVMSGDRFNRSHVETIGKPINSFYLLKTLGVYATNGDVPANPLTGLAMYGGGTNSFQAGDFAFLDLDGDYLIDPFASGIVSDKLATGDPNPTITGGWTNNFTYKHFTLGLFFTYTFKRDVLNLYKADQFNTFAGSGGNAPADLAQYALPDLSKLNFWSKPGDHAEYAKLDIASYRYYYRSDQTFFLTPGDYVRLKSLSLSYELAGKVLNKLKLDRFRIFGVVDNLARWQRSKDLPDAEAVNGYGEYNGNGYPIPKKITLGLEVNF